MDLRVGSSEVFMSSCDEQLVMWAREPSLPGWFGSWRDVSCVLVFLSQLL